MHVSSDGIGSSAHLDAILVFMSEHQSAQKALQSRAFAKLCGAGNDFIVLDGADGLSDPSPAQIRRLCDRRYGIGADGLMVLRPGQGHGPGVGALAFELDFYNADGSGGMLCGNGARCALERARMLGLAPPGTTLRFRFGDAEYSGAALSPGQARLDLDPGYRMDEPITIAVRDLLMSGRFVDVGSLHFVIDIGAIRDSAGRPVYSRIDDVPVATLGKAVRSHAAFGPSGVNANFTELRGGRLYVRTFERGVEDETLACGTGSVSSALARWHDTLLKPPLVVVARSGDELVIDWRLVAGAVEDLSLSGPAFMSFEGRFSAF